MKTKKLFISLVTFTTCITFFYSCQNPTASKISKQDYKLTGTIDSTEFKFGYDSSLSRFNLNFDNDVDYVQDYEFDQYGTLIKKRGYNFFNEEEIYLFDVNNSLREFRKVMRINDKKNTLQEFIRYKNGIIDSQKSHYFDYFVVDSNDNKYQVQLSYLGGFNIGEIKILENNFEFQISELEKSKTISSSNTNSILFWVDKDKIYESEFGYFQINVSIEVIDHKGLAKEVVKGNGSKNIQKLILRKFK